MHELEERIRSLIDAGARPVTADEARVTHKSQEPSQLRSQRSPRGKPLVLFSVGVLVVALALVVAGLTVTRKGLSGGVSPASAATFLKIAAKKAESQTPLIPGPGQFLYVRNLEAARDEGGSGARPWWFYVQDISQEWSSPTQLGRGSFESVGQPEFVSAADRLAWEEAGSPLIETGYALTSPDYLDVGALPTQVAKIRKFLDSQSGPDFATDGMQGDGKDASWEFNAATEFLEAGASSKQRAALLRFMATIPGVRYLGSAVTAGTHRRGTLLSSATDHPGLEEQAVIDPKTSMLLEVRQVIGDPSAFPKPSAQALAKGLAEAPLPAGGIGSYLDPVVIGIVNSTQAYPRGSPPLPTPWPYGTGREPLSGSVYP